MALSKGSSVLAACLALALGAGIITGGSFLRNKLNGMGSVDLAGEEQKCLFVGTYKQRGGYDVSVIVKMTSPGLTPVSKTIAPGDFDYNTSGQQSDLTRWIDLKDWAMKITSNTRIDKWIEGGGVLEFCSMCGAVESAFRKVKNGGGSYFVSEPKEDGTCRVHYDTVVLQIPEEDIN